MRVVLKYSETGRFFQPNGTWTADRETAKDFASVVVAYWSALGRGLQGADVWLAFDDPKDDFACMKVQPGLNRPIINCEQSSWEQALNWHLYNGLEVDLLNFDQILHGRPCDLIAEAFDVGFGMVRDTVGRTVHFRKKSLSVTASLEFPRSELEYAGASSGRR